MKANIDRLAAIFFSEKLSYFIVVWLLLGMLVNDVDQRNYTLQHAGIDAIVTHHTFQLGFSEVDRLRNVGDIFYYKDMKLAAKQPGQFFFGAVAYQLLSLFGYSYEINYVKTAALVTFFSSGLFVAVASWCIFQLLLNLWHVRRRDAYIAATAYALGSNVTAYSGVPHHDVMAGALLMVAFFFFEKDKESLVRGGGVRDRGVRGGGVTDSEIRGRGAGVYRYVFVSGLCTGLVPFMSMLASLLALSLSLYVISHRNWQVCLRYLAGVGIGISPLAIYNSYYFANPFTQANVAGNFKDTFFILDYDNFTGHLNNYLGTGPISIWQYMPIVLMGFFGILFLLMKRKRAASFVIGAVSLHLFYIFNIETIGHCQYGPRYLLPLIPFLVLGLPFLLNRPTSISGLNSVIEIAVISVYGISLALAVIGAIGGTMHCALHNYAPLHYWRSISAGTIDSLPLFTVCFSLLGLYFIAAIIYRGIVYRRIKVTKIFIA